MTILALTLELPDELAREAQDRGLLTSEKLGQVIRAEIERQRQVDRLFETMDKLAALKIPPLSSEEIQAEIRAARTERRMRRAGSS